jgi:hypothetical protein
MRTKKGPPYWRFAAVILASLVPGVALTAMTDASAAGTRPTQTTIALSSVSTGNNTGVWAVKATVSSGGKPVVVAAGEIAFSVFTASKALGTYVAPAADPEQCTVGWSVDTSTHAKLIDAVPPDRCKGGIGGYLSETATEVQGLYFRARYEGGAGWAPSSSLFVDESGKLSGRPRKFVDARGLR